MHSHIMFYCEVEHIQDEHATHVILYTCILINQWSTADIFAICPRRQLYYGGFIISIIIIIIIVTIIMQP